MSNEPMSVKENALSVIKQLSALSKGTKKGNRESKERPHCCIASWWHIDPCCVDRAIHRVTERLLWRPGRLTHHADQEIGISSHSLVFALFYMSTENKSSISSVLIRFDFLLSFRPLIGMGLAAAVSPASAAVGRGESVVSDTISIHKCTKGGWWKERESKWVNLSKDKKVMRQWHGHGHGWYLQCHQSSPKLPSTFSSSTLVAAVGQ